MHHVVVLWQLLQLLGLENYWGTNCCREAVICINSLLLKRPITNWSDEHFFSTAYRQGCRKNEINKKYLSLEFCYRSWVCSAGFKQVKQHRQCSGNGYTTVMWIFLENGLKKTWDILLYESFHRKIAKVERLERADDGPIKPYSASKAPRGIGNVWMEIRQMFRPVFGFIWNWW